MASYVKKYVVERFAFFPPSPPTYDTVDDIVVSESTFILHLNPGKCLSEEGRNFVILYSHGNAEDLGTVRKELELFASRWDVEIVAYDYTGYGPFQDQLPSEASCYKNIDVVLDYLAAEDITKDKIVLMGRSLGSGPTCHAASQSGFAGVVLLSPLFSAVRVKLPWSFSGIDIFENFQKIESVHCPLLVFHGEVDRVVPYSHSIELCKLVPNLWKFITVEDACHNDLLMGPARMNNFLLNVADFLDSLE